MKIQAGMIGATGYAGGELLRILLRHPSVSVSYLASLRVKSPAPFEPGRVVALPLAPATEPGRVVALPLAPAAKGLTLEPFDARRAMARCDLLFLALPPGEAMRLAPKLVRKPDLRIIDFSGDFRLQSVSAFRQAYGLRHTSTGLLKEAAYGLPELNRERIRSARLVANPGCYPTAALLALAPLAEQGLLDREGVVVDAKSGVSGAGRAPRADLMFCEVHEDLRAYKVDRHQHLPEMEQELRRAARRKIPVTFVPHLVPMNRGLYATVYVQPKKRLSAERLRALFRQRYQDEPFVRVLGPGAWPQVKSVNGSNGCELATHLDGKRGCAVVLCAIDNLGKGAAGQAVQNMNLLYGLPETTGLAPAVASGCATTRPGSPGS